MVSNIIASVIEAAIFFSFAYYIGHFVRWLIATIRRTDAKDSMALDTFVGSIVIVLFFLLLLSSSFGIGALFAR